METQAQKLSATHIRPSRFVVFYQSQLPVDVPGPALSALKPLHLLIHPWHPVGSWWEGGPSRSQLVKTPPEVGGWGKGGMGMIVL